MLQRLRMRLFGISPEETAFSRRGFRGDKLAVRPRLEKVGATFLHGYHAALTDDAADRLAQRLDAVENELRGFAYEGAAMGLALRDLFTPWRASRLKAFLNGPGAPHTYLMHVGAGWLPARLKRSPAGTMARLDPMLRWLAVDGYGFHEGYFHWPHSVTRQALPNRIDGYARRVFDQGLGRSLWFVDGADVARIPTTIAAFSEARRPDLWSGIGLACSYAGGVSCAEMETLQRSAGPYLSCLAQGSAFAAKARERACNPTEHTELACTLFCGLTAEAAARITDEALTDLAPDGALPSYEIWRRRIQAQFIK